MSLLLFTLCCFKIQTQPSPRCPGLQWTSLMVIATTSTDHRLGWGNHHK